MPVSIRKAHALLRAIPLACLMALHATGGHAEPLLAWREASNLDDLVRHLETWLDAKSDLPRNPTPVTIRQTSRADAAARLGHRAARRDRHTRGVYDERTSTIWLVRPWDPRDPRDVGVLLHELAHHRQAEAGHWYCDGAKELPAYRLQCDWLAEMGLAPEVNWIAVVLESGCTPRDIHPD